MESPSILKILPLSSEIFNFQLAHIPDDLLKGRRTASSSGPASEQFVGVYLESRKRTALLRSSFLGTPEDVSDVIRCDLRVQRLSGRKDNGGNWEAEDTCSFSENDDKDRVSQEDTFPVGVRNDYSEIDLARHIAEMENEGGSGGSGGSRRRGELTMAEEKFLFDELPSTVRFNDALVCTSKDIQILKSGTIKMMRLTVICDSDLHFQTHTQKHYGTRHSERSCFSNDRTAAKGAVPFAKTSTSSFHSSKQVNAEEGEYEMKGSPGSSVSLCMPSPSSSHQHSNHDEHHFISTVDEREKSKSVKSFPSSSTSTKWKRLSEKIRNVFQTYDIHVMGETVVDLNGCPLSSFQSESSPAVRFVVVEECEMRTSSTNIGKVSGKTEIIINNVHHISYYHRLLEKVSGQELHLYGLEVAGKVLRSVIEIQVRKQKQGDQLLDSAVVALTEFSQGLLISGPSGCGKVLVVRETAKKVGAHLLCFNPVGSGSGTTSFQDVSHFCQQLTKIFMSALVTASRYPTVLLFPRIHLLFQSSSNGSNSSSPFFSGKSSGFNTTSRSNRERVLHHLCKLFDSIPGGLALSVVGTTDKAFLLPPQLRRAGRLEKEIIISPPTEMQRLGIIKEIAKNLPQMENMDFSLVASQTPGYVGQDLLKLLRLALFKCEEENCTQVSEHHVKYALGRVLPSVLEGALGVVDIQRAISLDHIAGLHSVKLDLIKAIMWPLKHPSAFIRMGISPPKGILLYGPPGNCKTTLVRAVAASHQTNFLSVSAAELFSSGVGDSEKIVTHLFHRARMASPCILFIDELESIVGSRQNSGKTQTSTNESILSMLLTEMDGVGVTKIQDIKISSKNAPSLGPLVLVVAATNRPDLIDPALLRPGRFDKLIPVPPLDEKGRQELFELCSKSIPFQQDVDFSKVAEDTEYYSGADLVNLCREAALFALSEDMGTPFVTERHVSMARSMVGPSLTPAMVRAFHEYGSKSSC